MTSYTFLKMAATIAKYYFRFRICWCRCLQKIKVYQESKFRRHNSIYGWNITTSVFEKQTSVILEFYFAVIGVSFCIWLPSFVQFGTYAAEIWRHIDIRMAAVSHVLSPRLLAEPWRQEERCARAGSKWESTPLCLQQLHQFVQLVRISISTRCDQFSVRSYILLQCHCYTESPLCSLLETANQPDAAPAGSLM